MEAALHAGSLLAAGLHQPLSENSHQGRQLSTVALHPGIGFVNSNTATGMRVCLYDEGRGSRCTGKERDSESGLDYFGARYFGSALGRFTSADWSAKPEPVPYADFSNPQTLNQYAYVLNNPLGKPDSDGHCAEDLCIVEGTAGAAAGVYVLGGAALAGAAAYLNTPSGQRSLSTFTTAFASSVSSSVDSIKHLITEATGKPGTLGKPDHQETAKEEAKKIGGDREVPIPIPAGGMKGLRKADAAAKDETGKITDVTQVYRPTPAGNIPKREKDAASDIEKATGVKPKMVPVRPLPAQ